MQTDIPTHLRIEIRGNWIPYSVIILSTHHGAGGRGVSSALVERERQSSLGSFVIISRQLSIQQFEEAMLSIAAVASICIYIYINTHTHMHT